MRQIPTSTDVLYSQVTTLDGTDYTFTFALNLRDGRWYFDLADADGNPIALSIACAVNWDLLRRVLDPRRPPGKLVCLGDVEAGPDEAPNLVYVEAAEL